MRKKSLVAAMMLMTGLSLAGCSWHGSAKFRVGDKVYETQFGEQPEEESEEASDNKEETETSDEGASVREEIGNEISDILNKLSNDKGTNAEVETEADAETEAESDEVSDIAKINGKYQFIGNGIKFATDNDVADNFALLANISIDGTSQSVFMGELGESDSVGIGTLYLMSLDSTAEEQKQFLDGLGIIDQNTEAQDMYFDIVSKMMNAAEGVKLNSIETVKDSDGYNWIAMELTITSDGADVATTAYITMANNKYLYFIPMAFDGTSMTTGKALPDWLNESAVLSGLSVDYSDRDGDLIKNGESTAVDYSYIDELMDEAAKRDSAAAEVDEETTGKTEVSSSELSSGDIIISELPAAGDVGAVTAENKYDTLGLDAVGEALDKTFWMLDADGLGIAFNTNEELSSSELVKTVYDVKGQTFNITVNSFDGTAYSFDEYVKRAINSQAEQVGTTVKSQRIPVCIIRDFLIGSDYPVVFASYNLADNTVMDMYFIQNSTYDMYYTVYVNTDTADVPGLSSGELPDYFSVGYADGKMSLEKGV